VKAARATLGLLLLLGAVPARAGGLNVSPIQINLSPTLTKSLLVLRNDGNEAVRYQVSAHAWAQGPRGEMELSPTKDIVFLPALFALKPGEERNVRIGVATPFGNVEKTYRVFVEELPPAEKPSQPVSQVRVLTRVGVPVFLAPAQVLERRSIEGISVAHGLFHFKVTNGGTAHFREETVRVRGLDTTGKELFAREQRGWYVLAGGSLDYDVELPKECAGLATLVAQVITEKGESFEERLPAKAASCAP
jgi:fimbrial chaperone protein